MALPTPPFIKIYHLYQCDIRVLYSPQLISIDSPIELKKLLATNGAERSAHLVNLIKSDYLQYFSVALKISSRSLIFEIWAHVLASNIAIGLLNNFSMKTTTRLAHFILSRSHKIDCGERPLDSNRIVWDILSPFKFLLLPFIGSKKQPIH